MKKPVSILALILILILNACHDKYTESHLVNVPIYMGLDEWRNYEVVAENPQLINTAGKIYIYENFLFIVDRGLGIHIVNNSNPSAPQNLAFLPVHGCMDLAVQNDVLYVDSYSDLLSFRISDPANPQFLCRINEAFDSNFQSFVAGFDENLPIMGIDESKGVIVGWRQERVTKENTGQMYYYDDLENAAFFASPALANVSTGIGGSMAQFTIASNHLYVLRPSSITAFNLASDVCPQQGERTDVSWNAETIFPYNNHLFLGTTTGMMIFSIQNPGSPQFVSSIEHLTACDPVVVQDDRAYVTIRSGNTCMGTLNQLMVIDISNYSAPSTIAEYNLVNPHGLGIDGNTLFICDGSAGLKVFNAENDLTILDNILGHYKDINTYDVIPFNDVLIMSAEEGIYQYDYSDPENITELSFIPVN